MNFFSSNISASGITRFTIIERGGCVMVEGALPPKWISAITKAMPTDAIIAPELARMTGANFAFGRQEDVEALVAELKPAVDHVAVAKYTKFGLSESAARWLSSGERGISSNSIFTYLTGFDALQGWIQDYPRDPWDFRRCRLLLEQVPEIAAKFPEMAKASKKWAALVSSWDAICVAMDIEIPHWRAPKHKDAAPQTYQLIKAALGQK